MASHKKRTLFLTLAVILGCAVVGFMFWSSDEYRAATPLVFIFGAIILLVPAINSLIELFMTPQRRTLRAARMAVLRQKSEERALWRSGMPQLIVDLYFGHIRNYPDWIKQSRDYVPSSVTNAGLTEEGWVRMLMFYTDYIFPFKELDLPNRETVDYKEGVLEVVREGVRVLTLRVASTVDKKGAPWWGAVSIEGIHFGPWTKDFLNLKTEIIAIIKDRERDARES